MKESFARRLKKIIVFSLKMYTILLFILLGISHICHANELFTAGIFDHTINITIEKETGTKDTTEDYSIQDICNASPADEHSTDPSKRSIDYWFRTPKSAAETTTEVLDIYDLSDAFIKCLLTAVEPECYQKLQNGSVYVPMYNMMFNRGNYVINQDLLLVCPDFFDNHLEPKFSSNIDTISIVGVFISTVCILLHIIMFVLVKKMRNLPGYCMLSLCLALMATYICSFIQFKLSNHANCSAIGMIIYFSLLSSYFWMNVISFDVWQSIHLATTKLQLSSDRPVVIRFSLYSLYGWGTPLLILIAAIVTDRLSNDVRFKLEFNEHTCWFKNRTSLLIYFATPLFIVLFANILFFILSFKMITQSAMTKRNGSHNGSDLRSRLFLTLKLGTAMGLMWIFGVLAIVTEQEWVYYLYSACNALQGVFIFFSFTVNDKTLKACKNVSKNKKWSVLPGPFPKLSFFNTSVQTTSDSENK